jgi:hypothetical protein
MSTTCGIELKPGVRLRERKGDKRTLELVLDGGSTVEVVTTLFTVIESAHFSMPRIVGRVYSLCGVIGVPREHMSLEPDNLVRLNGIDSPFPVQVETRPKTSGGPSAEQTKEHERKMLHDFLSYCEGRQLTWFLSSRPRDVIKHGPELWPGQHRFYRLARRFLTTGDPSVDISRITGICQFCFRHRLNDVRLEREVHKSNIENEYIRAMLAPYMSKEPV